MDNSSIVIFRYHDNFELVYQRIRLIKMLDPDIKVYGIFGGRIESYAQACSELNTVFDNNYLVNVEDSRWKWLHADITYKMWFNDVGKNINFSFAYVLEWDLLILGKLEDIFPKLYNDTVYCTGIIPLEKVAKFWYWSNKDNKPKITAFYNRIRQQYKREFIEYASLGPGLCAPRAFFEGLLKLELFEADITDEVKIPIWCQLLDLRLESNNFYNKWFSYFEMLHFNANVANIATKHVEKEMKKKFGKRVFHPFRENIKAEVLFEIYKTAEAKFGRNREVKIKSVTVILSLAYKIHCKLMNWNTK